MNEQKIKKLFAAARNEAAPVPSKDFAGDVLRAVRREPPESLRETTSIFDQLSRMFPRFALAATVVIVLGVATDYGLTAAGVPDLGDGVSQISAEWLFTGNGF
ncbi:MAG TPA: hypothetical protein VNN22_17760 [Verrucomicrobiae bacterium]|nr:hypothetical protein [Verrucomicrobiae bacterium]